MEPFNAIKECVWTPKELPAHILDTIPRVHMTEYQMNISHLAQSMRYLLKGIPDDVQSMINLGRDFLDAGAEVARQRAKSGERAQTLQQVREDISEAVVNTYNSYLEKEITQTKNYPDRPYWNLYRGEMTNMYTLPYYGSYHHQISNSWGKNKGIQGAVMGVGAGLANIAMPSGGILTVKQYQGNDGVNFDVEFVLLNTTKRGWSRNKDLVDILIQANLPFRINRYASLPPSIYSVHIPGVRWSPVCSIANVQVLNEGQLHFIEDRNIPDAWKIILQFQELIPEARQLYLHGVMGGDVSRVQVINNDGGWSV